MRARKSSGLVSTAGAVRLMTNAMMGAAFGLAFGLALCLTNRAIVALLNDGDARFVFVLTLVTTFSIGATLTGAVFILFEDKEF